MRYTTLFFDADDTLLDFQECERSALEKSFQKHGLDFNEDIRKLYGKINQELWSAFERGEITKPQILATRFRQLFSELSIEGVDKSFEADYQGFLASNGCTIPGAVELCRELSEKFDLYLLTNGVAFTQKERLSDSGLLPYVKGVFVSEDIGFQKPAKEYFEAVLERVPQKDKKRILMIGDSLNSDILGGNRAELFTCWYNPKHKENGTEARPDWEVCDYEELRRIIYQE